MLVVRVELHSAITRKITEIAQMCISNVGGTTARGNYEARTFIKGSSEVARAGQVYDYPRQSKHVWNLVARALHSMSYK